MKEENNFPPRFIWAAEQINIRPDAYVLEIGCGAGIFADILSNKLTTGQLIAADRSASQINKAVNRNREKIERGTLICIHSECAELKISPASLDAVVAFNVGFFLKGGETELTKISGWLKPAGKLFVFYQPPSEQHPPIIQNILSNPGYHNFHIVRQVSRKFVPATAWGIIAVPDKRHR